MAELLVVGGIVFWLLIVVEIAALFYFTEKQDSGLLATLSLIVFLAVMQFGFKVDLFNWSIAHWDYILYGAGVYLIGGTIWGVIKWYLYVRDRFDRYYDLKMVWLAERNQKGPNIPDELQKEWNDFINRHPQGDKLKRAPSVHENKSRIIRWMSFWVASMAWTFLHDFVRRVFNELYRFISTRLQAISDRIYADVSKDFGNN